MGGVIGRDFLVLCIANLLTPFRMRSRGPYCEGVGMSGNSRYLCTVLTADTYCAKLSLVLMRPEETSHCAKKQSTHGSMGIQKMFASLQNSLNAFHSDVMAFRVLEAQACCCTNFICLASLFMKTRNKIKLEIKHFRFDMALYRVDSNVLRKDSDPFLGFFIGWSRIGVCQPVIAS